MTLELKTPYEIYQRVNDELTKIVNSLDNPSDDATLNQAQGDARNLLSQYQTKLREQLTELEKFAEWRTFTIAFYGETGAGKSTVIETLRILLQERSKLTTQQKFRQLRDSYNSCTEKLKQLYNNNQDDQKHAEQKQSLTEILQQYEREYSDTLAQVRQIQTQIAERKYTEPFWQKLLNLFRKTAEDIALIEAQEKLKLTTEAVARKAANTMLGVEQNQASQNSFLEDQLHEITNQMAELLTEMEQYADGEIIGDGRPDFTRETHRYDFELEGEPFALLDVPGIEGKEGLVLNQIEQAVQTAHAVFYVTNRPTPPQTGDNQHKGTLEKIKEHLGAQTEVWTLFNKKIMNPRTLLAGRPLVSEDENAGIADLNKKMHEQLGEHYRETFSLSAQPAFLAATDHFVPSSQNATRRNRILESGTTDDLLDKTRLRAFLQFLNEQLIHNSKDKITRANFNKAKEVLDQASLTITNLQQNFTELAKKLKHDGISASDQLSSSFKALKKRIESLGETIIDEFESEVRKEMYRVIDNDISNDTFKQKLEEEISAQQESLSKKVPEVMKKEVERFQQDVESIFKRFEKHARELSKSYTKLQGSQLNDKFDIKINLDSGIRIRDLSITVIGAGLLALTPLGWVIIGFSAISLVFSMFKAVRGFFSTSYKQAQQRKSTDENLRNITQQLRDSLRENLENVLPEMKQKIGLFEQALAIPAKQTSALVESLANSNAQLQTLSRQIAHTGKL